jgi:hypothetical protein
MRKAARFFSEFFGFPLSVSSFYQGSILIIWGKNNRSVGGCSSEM